MRSVGSSSVLVVDEAQAIESVKGFEELRLLTNFQLNDRFLLTVVLIGQPELRHRVAGIPQLNQRIAVRAHVGSFTAEETTSYISVCMRAATHRTDVFTKEAVSAIYEQSKGIGRLINALCDQCLFAGAIEHVLQIDDRLVQRSRSKSWMMNVRMFREDSPLAMNEYSMTDWYRIAQEQLTGVALAVQRQDELNLEAVAALATGIAESLKGSDQLLVQAMSGPAGPRLITNLVNVGILATKVGARSGISWERVGTAYFCGASARHRSLCRAAVADHEVGPVDPG